MKRTAIWAMFLIAALAFPGCKEDAPKRAASSAAPVTPQPPPKPPIPDPPKVKVIADPAQIASAKKAYADSQEKVLLKILSDLDELDESDAEAWKLIKANRDRSVKALSAMRDDNSKYPQTRLQAMILLKKLGVAPDITKVTQIAGSEQGGHMVLMHLPQLFDAKAPLPLVLHPLVFKSIDAPDEGVRKLGNEVLARFAMPEAITAINAKIKNGDPNNALVAAVARVKPDRDSFNVLITRFGNVIENEKYFLVRGLGNIAESTKDPALAKECIDRVLAYSKASPDVDMRYADQVPVFTVEILATVPPPEQAKTILADLARGAQNRLIRGETLAQLRRLDKPLSLKISRELKLIKADDGPVTASTTQPTDAQTAALMIKHGLLTKQEVDQALLTLKKHAGVRDDRGMDFGSPETPARALLWGAKRYIAFSASAHSEAPVRHDKLIVDIARASAGKLKLEAVLEIYDPNGGATKYTVQFMHGGKLYRVEPQDFTNWYDVPAVLSALNKACADAGFPERFTPLLADGHVVELVFAKPSALEAGAAELKMSISPDPDDAHKQGIGADRLIPGLDE